MRPSFNIADVPRLEEPWGRWELIAPSASITPGDGWAGGHVADVWVWRTPRFQVTVLVFHGRKGGSFYAAHHDHVVSTHELNTDSFGRLDVVTRADAFKVALAHAALTLIPQVAWLLDELGVPRCR